MRVSSRSKIIVFLSMVKEMGTFISFLSGESQEPATKFIDFGNLLVFKIVYDFYGSLNVDSGNGVQLIVSSHNF